jgi:undecaprenyl-phosphate galactose phosphotransferase/putative colanic acid biosynthesis UDP-glucose lipid carrier transferase
MNQIVRIANPAKASWVSRRLAISYYTVAAFVGGADGVLIVLASVFADWFYNVLIRHDIEQVDIALGIGFCGGLGFILLAKALGLYNMQATLNPHKNVSKIVFVWGTVFFSLTAVLFLLRVGTIFSRGTIIIFAFTELGVLLGARFVSARLLRSVIAQGGVVGRRAVIVGEPAELGHLSAKNLLLHFGLKELARVTIAGAGEKTAEGLDIAALDLAMDVARRHRADELVVAVDWRRTEVLEKIKERFRASPLAVRLLPDRTVRATIDRQVEFSPETMPSVELQRAPLTAIERLIKRAFDIALASAATIVLLPLMLVVALLIKLDSKGPVLFRQQRIGFDGQTFHIYKFRTMTVMEDGPVVVQAARDDCRVTRLGALLRQTSIDELPQLLNVIKGDMSLIGPRPHALAHDDHYGRLIATYAFRHHVKPGMSGWAQVNGQRGETARVEDMRKRVDLDLWYINNWSLTLDLKIILQTSIEVTRQRAY